MNRLDPDLKRLLRLSHHSESRFEAPLGFATRIVARADLRDSSPSPDLQRSLAVVNWLAALLLLAGVLYWQMQHRAPMAGQFAQAAQFAARNLTP